MKKYSLLSCVQKMLRTRGSVAGIRLYHPNLIKGIKLNGPNQLWATDLTYIKLTSEYVYLNAIIDVYTRRIVTRSYFKWSRFLFLKSFVAKKKGSLGR